MSATSDTERLRRDEARPPAARLWRALGRLRSTLTFMNTGAHPDDEHSGLLAWLRHGRGMRVAIACSTRGEGGQNALGPERGDALGLIRSAEMQDAARLLDAHLLWLGFGTGDPVHDFGFSKDGDDTLRRWQGDLIVRRLAGGYRLIRPDIVLPTFLDVPGQHGHHRAMTRAAQAALALAADAQADLGAVAGADLPPWKVAKFYLPAWSGGGGTYDDEMPPPPATLTITADPAEPLTGAPYDRIGEWSRRRHASQGMGRWPDPPRLDWRLHRPDGTAEGDIAEGLPDTLADLAAACPELPTLPEAARQVDAAIAAFPNIEAVIPALLRAKAALREAETRITGRNAVLHVHRIARKRQEIALALAEAAGLSPRLSLVSAQVPAGGETRIELSVDPEATARVIEVEYHLPPGASLAGDMLRIAPEAAETPNFRLLWSPFGDRALLRADLSFALRGQRITVPVPAWPDLRILPAATLALDPPDILLTPWQRQADLRMTGPAAAQLDQPEGLRLDPRAEAFRLTWPETAPPGRQVLRARGPDGQPAFTSTPVVMGDGTQAQLVSPAIVTLLAVETAPPEGRIGIFTGTDRSAGWLVRLGADLTRLERPEPAALADLDTVVLGVMAMGRPDVDPAALRAFVEGGGNLVSFYQRPDHGWNADASAPRRLRVGTPSLRWRVTDPDAPVTVLDPGHPLLHRPNRIGAEDWRAWVKDRGLYFAADWDPAYKPLLSLSDRGEAPLTGALISARIGRGRHTHCALSLPQQLDALVPGAFRLLVNLTAPEA